MKRFVLICAALLVMINAGAETRKQPKKIPFTHETVELPAVEPKVIAVETGHTAQILQVDKKGVVRTVHYGDKIKNPGQFLSFNPSYSRSVDPGALIYPAAGGRFVGQPAFSVRYPDGTRNTELYYTAHEVAGDRTTLHLKDYVTAMEVDLVYEAFPEADVIASHAVIRNAGKAAVELTDFASSSMTVTARKYLLTHFHGSWAEEMQVDREVLGHGTKVLESRRGIQTSQCSNPSFVLSLDTAQWSETTGEVIAGSLAWSGNWRISFEEPESGAMRIVAGINPYASAWPLKAGETFTTPDMIWTWSGQGAGQASRNLHRWARKSQLYAGSRITPILLNNWEGTYFDFNTKMLLDIIDDAASMGLEMFVLDDGWFGNDYPRDNDRAGLGDWELNTKKLPEGIDYIASYAHDKGLKFGIWIEPEMVNPVSNLARQHPEWIVQSPGREMEQIRNQWTLDLSNPDVQDFVYGVFDRTMSLSDKIDYIKWDCNRSITSFGSPYLGPEQDRFFIGYIQGLYKVLDRVRAKYPDTIIQCCSSGGARVDYGQLRYFNEVWTSDNSDGDSRIRIQYGTSLIYPACIMGAHVSVVPNHQTGNITPLKFRLDLAATGRLGMELQPKSLTPAERAFADRCINSYKQYRDIVFGGDLYRLASPYDGEESALMYVSEDKSRAVVFLFNLKYRNRDRTAAIFRLQGLDPARTYQVTEQNVDKSCWWGDKKSFTGDFLASGGFNPSLRKPHDSAVFLLEAL